MRPSRRAAALLLACAALLAGCVKQLERRLTRPESSATVDRRSPFLKAHMPDGTLYVLSPWSMDRASAAVMGQGAWLDVNRAELGRGTFRIPVDSVVLFETNVVRPSPGVAALGVITGISVGITIACAADPKACFGSCPTFYATDGARELLQAEGFSSSIAPSLEARDVDALYRARGAGPRFTLRMVNEAYETHVVRTANLLAVPRAGGTRVFLDDTGGFWATTAPVAPTACAAAEGDCLDAVRAFDGTERQSLADSTDLAARESVEVAFPRARGERHAVVLASRQSLLPTYLLYQAFAYLGTSVGQWMAAFERADPATRRRVDDVAATLGGIEVQVADAAGRWVTVTAVRETGPLAADVKLVPLPAGSDPARVRLRLARGAWRVDWVALTTITGAVHPMRLAPAAVLRDGAPDASARARLLDDARVLVTYPGDEYTLRYDLPRPVDEYELFLESRGYYLEWMRQEWIAEENPVRAAQLFTRPAEALKALAPAFKRVESRLEAAFWRSRYAGF